MPLTHFLVKLELKNFYQSAQTLKYEMQFYLPEEKMACCGVI